MFGSQSSGYSGLFSVLSHNRVNRTHSKHFPQVLTLYVTSLSLQCEKCQRCKQRDSFGAKFYRLDMFGHQKLLEISSLRASSSFGLVARIHVRAGCEGRGKKGRAFLRPSRPRRSLEYSLAPLTSLAKIGENEIRQIFLTLNTLLFKRFFGYTVTTCYHNTSGGTGIYFCSFQSHKNTKNFLF